jgi:Zn-dependent protease with chaperone function
VLKHIKPRDILEFILFGFGFLALVLIAAFLESGPIALILWVAVSLGFILWIIFAVIVARQRAAEAAKPRLKMMHNGQWMDVAVIEQLNNSPRRPVQLFDQDEDAIQHLDFHQTLTTPKENRA